MKGAAFLKAARAALCLAPMAGFSGRVFRRLCLERGADVVYTEMISARGLLHGNVSTRALLCHQPEDGPLVVQLFGSEPDVVARAAKLVEDTLGSDLLAIDLNMGCPAPKITGNGDGCALMRDLPLASRIIEQTACAVAAPVTVKFRKGWDEAHENAEEFARMCRQSGADAIAFHGRTRAQQYAGAADWEALSRVKRAVDIPVIGNGDVRDGASARRMLEETGCDALMIGRAALGDPFVFTEIRAALEGRPYTPPSMEERRLAALMHARLAVAERGERSIVELRKHLAFYARGARDASQLRRRINACETLAELEQVWP